MYLLTCCCLNINVNGKGDLMDPTAGSELNLPKGVLDDSFFTMKLYSVTLSLAGLKVNQKPLTRLRQVENWIVTTCTCCSTDIYAQELGDYDRVLVSSKAVVDKNEIESLFKSKGYSAVFKLILPEIDDNFIQNNFGLEFRNGDLDNSINFVQSQVVAYLSAEKAAMDNRIKIFTQEQHANYDILLQEVRKNKQAMIYLSTQSKENFLKKDNEPEMDSTITDTRESFTSLDSVFDPIGSSELDSSKSSHSHDLKSERRTNSSSSNHKKKSKSHSHRVPATIDVGGIFPMEEELGLSESGSECISDESDDTGINQGKDSVEDKYASLYASSVPMSVPAYLVRRRNTIEEVEEKEHPPIRHEDIAASMQALACSVSDGTEMFGELPRRRLNTGELLAFQPY